MTTADAPPGLLYQPDFLAGPDAAALINWIDRQPWQADLKRRVQHYGYRYDYRARRARAEDYLGPLPEAFAELAERLLSHGFAARPDQVVVNEYEPVQGNATHIDCAPCFGDVIASVSLLSACVMRLDARAGGYFEQVLAPRSALILSGPARHDWRHGIAARKSDMLDGTRVLRGRRVSVTFRTMRFGSSHAVSGGEAYMASGHQAARLSEVPGQARDGLCKRHPPRT